MREPAKINIDNTVETEEDKAWTARFLYPDGRKPYRLMYNHPQEYQAGHLVARARRATLAESETRIKELEQRIKNLEAQVTQSRYSFKKNGVEQPLTDGDIKVMDEMARDTNSFFERMSGFFKRLGG